MNLFLESPLWSGLVQALLHSLWQGALISVVLALALRMIPVRHSNFRYLLAAGSLVLLVFAWLATWSWVEHRETEAPVAAPTVSATESATDRTLRSGGDETVASAARPTAERTQRDAPAAVPQNATAGWRAWTGMVWFAGVLLFQIRLLLELGRTRNLVRGGGPVEDSAVLDRFAGLLDRFALRGKAVLWKSEAIAIPAVWGFFKPVILIPSACLARLDPAQLEAVLAHELAHIRRHDFVVNLVQMALEGVFFFNPFVWWIGRRIRWEREACCDVMAVEATGERTAYARALAAIAESTANAGKSLPQPALAMGREKGQLLERMRRLLYPHGTPELRVPVPSTAGILLLCGMSLFLLKTTTDAALEVLSPTERMERFTELRETYPDYEREMMEPADDADAEPITVRGVIRTHDGQPIPPDTWIHINARRPGYNAEFATHVDTDGRFTYKVDYAGTIHVGAHVDGYAPAFAGPLSDPEEWEDIQLALEPGFSASVRLIDNDETPVGGARVSARYDIPGNRWRVEAVSDEEGLVRLEDLGEHPVRLDVEADRFQTDFLNDVALEPGQTFSWVLQPAAPASGVVVFDDTGEPISGAQIHLGRRSGAISTSYARTDAANFLTETDDEGRFELRSLRDDARYHLLVTAPGASGIVAGPILAGDRDLRIALPVTRTVAVRVENVTSDHLDNEGRLKLTYSVTFRYGDSSYGTGRRFFAESEGSVAEFDVEPLWKLDAVFSVGDRAIEMSWDEITAQSDPVVIDLAETEVDEPTPEPVAMEVRVAFRTPENDTAPEGSVIFEYSHENRVQRVPVEVMDGRAEITIPSSIFAELLPSGLVGHWFAPRRLDLLADSSPLELEIELHPAGAIHGEVFEEDGRPVDQVLISVIPIQALPDRAGRSLGIRVKNHSSSGERRNRFMAGPLPFGGEYLIAVHRGTTYVLTEPISINPETPFHEVTLTMPEGIEVAGTVLRPDGQPLGGEDVAFRFSATPGYGFSGPTAMTDREGRFSFSGINPDVSGKYYLELKFDRDFQSVRRTVTSGERIDLQLEEGRVIEGQVIDQATGAPLEGIDLYARRIPAQRDPGNWPVWFEPEDRTDSEGRFRFSTLPPGEYEITPRNERVHTRDRTAEAGSGEPIVLSVER